MIERVDEKARVVHNDGHWEAWHDTECGGGPDEILVDGVPLLRDCRFYFDDLVDRAGVVRRFRDFRKGGAATVVTEGYFPFGNEIKFAHTCRYAANHVRVTFDFNWPRGMTVKRRLGIGSMVFPGQWTRFFCVPPALHMAEGREPHWQTIPAWDGKPVMIGHWHRPPLAVVLERADGSAIEIGTGTDVWRWEQCMGLGPECASYKLHLQEDGIEFVREPLMCCEEYAPDPREYRFSWYAAWRSSSWPKGAATASGSNPLILSPSGIDAALPDDDELHARCLVDAPAFAESARRTASALDQARGLRTDALCWQSPITQKAFRRGIRQIAARHSHGTLQVDGISAAPCWDPVHVHRRNVDVLAHWDVVPLLDMGVWTRQTLGLDWEIIATVPEPWNALPSLQGLFGVNGFENRESPDEA